jgi:hypothetical protein
MHPLEIFHRQPAAVSGQMPIGNVWSQQGVGFQVLESAGSPAVHYRYLDAEFKQRQLVLGIVENHLEQLTVKVDVEFPGDLECLHRICLLKVMIITDAEKPKPGCLTPQGGSSTFIRQGG